MSASGACCVYPPTDDEYEQVKALAGGFLRHCHMIARDVDIEKLRMKLKVTTTINSINN